MSFAHECNERIDRLSKNNNVKILCNTESMNFPSIVSVEEIPKNNLEDITISLEQFFAVYNPSFLKNNISSINILQKIKVGNSEVAGISNGREISINVVRYSTKQKRISSYTECLHHEFSSNIFRKTSSKNKNEWKHISNSYNYSQHYLLKCLNDPLFAEDISIENLKLGYLQNYSLTNEENDFNNYAEMLFMKEKRLLNGSKIYIKVNKKLIMLKAIYIEMGFIGKFPDELDR